MLKLPTVRDYMTTKVKTLSPETPILQAVDMLVKHAISGAPVCDAEGRVVGMLSEKDCLPLIAKGVNHAPPEGTVAEFMANDPAVLPPDMDLYYAAGVFMKKIYRRFPVVENGKLVGVISRRDILRAIHKILKISQESGDL
jgi:CBS domain-containing protein